MAAESWSQQKLEPAGVATRRVMLVGFSVLVLVAVALGSVAVFLPRSLEHPSAERLAELPAPRVDVDQAQLRQQLEARQRALLGNYAWADAGHRQVRVPIDRAMQLLIERGPDALAPLPPRDRTP